MERSYKKMKAEADERTKKDQRSFEEFTSSTDSKEIEMEAQKDFDFGPDDIGLRAPTDSYWVASGK